MELEWEAAAMPAWVLPNQGDRVHIQGNYIFDCAHKDYRTEIHPPRLLMTGAMSLAEPCLVLAEQSGDPGLLARALTRVAVTRMRQDPRPSAAIGLLDRAERLGSSKNDWRALDRAYLTRADEYELAGELEHALADRRRAVEAAQRCGEIERQVFAYHTVAETCLRMGAWRDGRDAARAGLALDLQGLLKTLPGAADLTWMEGRAHEGLGQLRMYIADARGRGDMCRESRSV